MKIRVELSMTVRQNKYVTVVVPDDFDDWTYSKKQELLSKVFDADEGDGYFDAPDPGCEEGSHYIVGKTDMSPEYDAVLEDGEVKVTEYIREPPVYTKEDALSRGFDAGNYANAYCSSDCETAWEIATEDNDSHDAYRSNKENAAAFRKGFIRGFYSSYEREEIDPDHLEEWEASQRDEE